MNVNVPVPLVLSVNEAFAGKGVEVVRVGIVPSGSVAETGILSVDPSATVLALIAAITGGRSVLVTVIETT